MPKAMLCIPDIYSSSENTCEKSQSMEKTTVAAPAVLETCNCTSPTTFTSPKTSPGNRKESFGSADQRRQKGKKGLQDSVKASLMSLKAASEMVREEKRRTSRQRSPGSSKEESPGSQNPSPERRSPRNNSPSNSSDSVDGQRLPIPGKKKAKKKIQLEERPKINIFTDNIGVELGKRVRSPRRLSEDMIALPIFSARRWSSSPREGSYIAEKSDGDGVSAKLSVEDQDPFKPPHAVSPNPPVTKGLGSVPAKKKGSFGDESHLNSVTKIGKDEVEEVLVCKKQSKKTKAKKDLLTSEEGDDNRGLVNKKKKKKKQRANIEPSDEITSFNEDIEGSFVSKVKEEPRKKSACQSSSDCEKNGFGSLIAASKRDQVYHMKNDDKHMPLSPALLSEENNTIVKISTGAANPSKSQKVIGDPSNISYPEHEEKAVSDGDGATKKTLQSPERTLSNLEDIRKKEENVQKSPKKAKGKSLVRAASGEKKKKQREKMKIGDEIMTSICRDIMSGVVITPCDQLEDKAYKNDQAFPKDCDKTQNNSPDLSTNQGSNGASVTMSSSSGLFNQAMINLGMSALKEPVSSSNSGLLQPAKNILTTPLSDYEASSTQVVTATVPSSICVSTTSSSTSSASVIPCDSFPVAGTSMPTTLSLCGVKPVFGHQFSTGSVLSMADDSSKSLADNVIGTETAQSLTSHQKVQETISDKDIKHSTGSTKRGNTLELNEILLPSQEKKTETKALHFKVESPEPREDSTSAIHKAGTQLDEAQHILTLPLDNESSITATAESSIAATAENDKAEVVIHSSSASKTDEKSPSNFVKTTSKESPQSSLLCAMLVGGSDVAYTYEKSKPSVAGVPPPSSHTENESPFHFLSQPAASMSEEKFDSTQHSITANNPAVGSEKPEIMTVDNGSYANCEVLSEKGDAPSSNLLEERSLVEAVDNDDRKKNWFLQNKKDDGKNDLKIDIVSKLRKLDETVFKLMDIDAEETFLGRNYSEPESPLGKSCQPKILKNNVEGKEMQQKSEEIRVDDKVLETPLYGVISNLATRLKGKTLTVDVEEMLESCPKYMLKICSQVDEQARWNTLKLRLKKEVEESKAFASLNNDVTIERDANLLSAASTKCKLESDDQNLLSSDLMEESKGRESICVNEGDISPQMTNSSSANDSLCELDPDAMTSAVNVACMDVSIDSHIKTVKDEPIEQCFAQSSDLDDSPGKFLVQKSKTFESLNSTTQKSQSTPLRRINSSPQLKVESLSENLISESLLDSTRGLHATKSKLGSKIPVPGSSHAIKTSKKTWRTPRIILEPKPLTVLSELEESSDSTKNIFTCPNLQKYLNVPSNRVIVPPHKKKEMQILDDRAKKDEEEREANMAERSDKERQEEIINLEYIKYEPDFDEIEGLLFMSFSCEAELTAHSRVEKALEWDKDGTMLRIAQTKAFEEAKQLKTGMEAVKFKHLRGQHMRWKKYRRLYSSEVKSILNGAPSSVEEHLRREAVSKAGSRKTSDVTKIKNWKSKSGVACQHLQKHRQKAHEVKLARKEKLQSKKLAETMYPIHSPTISLSGVSAEKVSQVQNQFKAEQVTSDQITPQWNKTDLGLEVDHENSFVTRSKRRKGFSHQKEHKQLFRELSMDWEDRMIHRKLGGWSLKGNRPKAFSQAAHKREEKQKLLLGEESSCNMLPLAESSSLTALDSPLSVSSNTPSRVSSSVDIASPSKDDVEYQKKRKSLKLVYPLLTERMARNALTAMINLRSKRRKNDYVDGNSANRNRQKSLHNLQADELPALRPILPHPANSHSSPVVMISSTEIVQGTLLHTPPRVQLVSSGPSMNATVGADLRKPNDNVATPLSSLSLTANINSSVPSSITPLQSSAASTPSLLAGTDFREDAIVMEGVDTVADMVSSPSIADSASSKSCGKPGCRYGCICHLCLSASSTSPVGKSLASTCDKEYCRLGCICDSLDPEKPIPEVSHCRQASCMLGCTCLSLTRTDRESTNSIKNKTQKIRERLKKRKAKLRHRNIDNFGNECDNIPYLPSMKRKPTNERFSNLPQREKTHRSAKNLDAITRKALMLYETSEIYCEKTERLPRRDQKDVTLGLSGSPLDDDFSFIGSAMTKPVIEIDSPPEDSMMPFEMKKSEYEGKISGIVGAASFTSNQRLPEYADNNGPSEGEEDVPSVVNMKFEDYLAKRHKKAMSLELEEERQAFPVLEQSTHKRKRKSHPLSSEIFTLSTCARTQPYNYKRKQRLTRTTPVTSESATSNLMRFTPTHTLHHIQGRVEQSLVSAQAKSDVHTSGVGLSLCALTEPQGSVAQIQVRGSSQATPQSSQESLTPLSVHSCSNVKIGSRQAVNRARFQQSWHTSMVCLKARGPPPKRKRVSSGPPESGGDDEEEDVQEEDEVKLLEFLANCNWEGARKEILGKVAQCLTRGQYPQPRTMRICEFLVEILPKAHKPSVIPEELRKKLPGKMYSIRVRVTRREVLPRAAADDAPVIDLSESSPVKAQKTPVIVPRSVELPFPPISYGVSGMSNLSANVGISGLSRMCVTSNSDPNSNQQRSASAPNSRRTSTDVIVATPLRLSTTEMQNESSLPHADTSNSSSVSITSVTSGVSILPYPLSTKASLVPQNTKHCPGGAKNTQARSLLPKKVSSVAPPTSNVVPFYYSVKPDDLKYMKIQSKDGLMQVVGVSNDKKALVTVPVSAASSDQPKGGSMKTCALPFITVPVCGSHNQKIVPIIPTPPLTSSSLPGHSQPILLKFPASVQAQGGVKGPVLFRPMGSQPQTSKLQPLFIPSTARSLIPANFASKGKLNCQVSIALKSQNQPVASIVASGSTLKTTSGNDEMIMTFDVTHMKDKSGPENATSESSPKKSSDVKKPDKLGNPHTTLVTSSLQGPIMSSEESVSTKKDQASSVSVKSKTESVEGKNADSQLCEKPIQVEDIAEPESSKTQERECKKHSDATPISLSVNKIHKSSNLYVPCTNSDSSSVIMVYPSPNASIKASTMKNPTAPLFEPDNAGPSSKLEVAGPSNNSSIVTSNSIVVAESTVGNSPASKELCCSQSLINTAPDLILCAASDHQPFSSMSSSLPSSVSQNNLTSACEGNKQGLKRKLHSKDDAEESTNPSDIQKRIQTYPVAHRQLPKLNEELDSMKSSVEIRMGLNPVGPFMSTVSSTTIERPISSMSTSLSTSSSDNLHIMLSSDESDIDVGESEDPSSIMALRENAERALENDHGYLRTGWSRSSSPMHVEDRSSKELNNKISQVLKNRRKDIDASEHNKRERMRRSKLKNLFLDLQQNVCQVTGAGFNPCLSRAKTLQQAKSVILNLVKRERDGQLRYQYELKKKNSLLKQREVLYSELSKTMPEETIRGIAEKAVKRCKKRRAALAKETSKLNQTVQADLSDRQEQTFNTATMSTSRHVDCESKALYKQNLATDFCLENSPLLPQSILKQTLKEPLEHKARRSISADDSQRSKCSANPGSKLSQAELEDTVDLISNSSGADSDQGSVEAYQGSLSPARYEDISEPEEETTVQVSEAKRSTEPEEATASKSKIQEAPDSAQCYEDISDVEESKLPNYEDISDS